MAVTQYIGARYVPILADPLEWDNTRSYEPLTIVTYQGDSYTSRQYVPVGMSISNESYWAQTGNYDGQVEAYRQETQRVSDALSSVESTAGTAASDAESALAKIGTGFNSTDTVRAAVDGISNKIGTLPAGVTDVGTELGSLAGDIASANGDIDAIETTLTGFDATHQVKAYVDNAIGSVETQLTKHAVFIGDSFSTTTFVTDANRWCRKVARALHVTPHIYADNGAGFLRPGNNTYNFTNLATQAVNDSSFTNSDVHYVFVLGGLNDLRSEYIDSAFTTGVKDLIDVCRASFTNAQIVICGVNAWSDGFTWVGTYNKGNLWAEIQIQDTIRAYAERVSFIGMAWCLGFNENLYAGNPSLPNAAPHPNAAGHIAMANWILSYLFGSGVGRSLSTMKVYGSDDSEVGVMSIHARADMQEIVLNLSADTGASNTIHDDYNILGEYQFIIQGLTLNTTSTTEKAFVGARQSTGIKTVYYGYGRLTRVNC